MFYRLKSYIKRAIANACEVHEQRQLLQEINSRVTELASALEASNKSHATMQNLLLSIKELDGFQRGPLLKSINDLGAFQRDSLLKTINNFGASQRESLASLQNIANSSEKKFSLAEIERGLQSRDLILLINAIANNIPDPIFTVETSFPIALDSDDHLFPLGTRNDNTRYPRFVRACERLFGEQITFMDLGCAGGGLVWDFLLRGHQAIGLEGSDFSLLNQRAEWRILPEHLFTCDITKPFTVRLRSDQSRASFQVISAWEFMEHIPTDSLPCVFSNVCDHLADNGYFVGSIATFECTDEATGAVYHHSVYPQEWWVETFIKNGMVIVEQPPFTHYDYSRGVGNGEYDEDFATKPIGFHFVAQKCE